MSKFPTQNSGQESEGRGRVKMAIPRSPDSSTEQGLFDDEDLNAFKMV